MSSFEYLELVPAGGIEPPLLPCQGSGLAIDLYGDEIWSKGWGTIPQPFGYQPNALAN